MAKETSLRNDLGGPVRLGGDGIELGVVRIAVPREQCGGERRDGLQRRAEFVGDVGDQLAGGGQLLTAEQLLPHGVLFLQLQRGCDLVGQVLHGRLFALAEIMEAPGVVNLQHTHQLALREHRNQQYRARRQHRVFFLEVRAAPNVWNGKQRMVAEAGRDSRGHGSGRGFGIDGLERGVVGVYRLERFRRAIVDIQADAGGIRQRGKIEHQAAENLGGRGGADHLLAQRVEQPHLLSQRRHAPLTEPPDGRQRAGQNERG